VSTHGVDVGTRIAKARDLAGLTQEQLAAASGVPRTVIAKIERSHRRVGALELVDIAGGLGIRVEWLLSEAPAGVVAHRTRLDPELDVASIDQELEKVARDASLVFELDSSLVPPTIPVEQVPTTSAEAESLAKKARSLAKLKADQPVYDLVGTAAKLGLFAFSAPLGADTADAASTIVAPGGVALINSTNSVGRRRLALAHELGHYFVRDDYAVDWRVAEHSSSDKTEVLLDRFARAFLLPAPALGARWKQALDLHSVRTAAVITASHFNVDMSTLARRLVETNFASHDESNAIRGVKTLKADIVEHDLKVTYEMAGRSVSVAYAKSVLRMYSAERISAERALDVLFGAFAGEDLPPLQEPHADEIWSLLS
jgi:Zn-dependent peptidase ImmA (M78 family)/DNA-binding XRE family transcriptional regulator